MPSKKKIGCINPMRYSKTVFRTHDLNIQIVQYHRKTLFVKEISSLKWLC